MAHTITVFDFGYIERCFCGYSPVGRGETRKEGREREGGGEWEAKGSKGGRVGGK